MHFAIFPFHKSFVVMVLERTDSCGRISWEIAYTVAAWHGVASQFTVDYGEPSDDCSHDAMEFLRWLGY